MYCLQIPANGNITTNVMKCYLFNNFYLICQHEITINKLSNYMNSISYPLFFYISQF